MASSSNSNAGPERTSSQLSTASRKSSKARVGSRKHSLVTPTSAKTLESFPSLSPEASPEIKSPKRFVASPQTQSPKAAPLESQPKNHPSIVQSLITSTPSFRGRSALFDDVPKENSQNVPGALHLATDRDIKRLVDKNGAITVIRQISEDLAQRDAEMTAFRRRAEEREKELKKMLREVEVSNRDIETRLHRISKSADKDFTLQDPPNKAGASRVRESQKKDKTIKGNDGIDEMMGEALNDDVGRLSAEIDEGYLDSLDTTDKNATLKARSLLSKESDGRSMSSSVDSQSRPSSTFRGWRNYLWSGNGTSRRDSQASSVISDCNEEAVDGLRNRGVSGSNTGRKKLEEDLFQPLARASTTQLSTADQSRKSSTSAASWSITKLFAGNNQGSRDPVKQNTVRGRSATIGGGQGKPSATSSGPPPTSAQAALMKVKTMESSTNLKAGRKDLQPHALNSNSASKASSQPRASQIPASPSSNSHATNLGPVEMDTIHPQDSKPPTLVQYQDMGGGSPGLLTDRFGFIYDQRRRKRSAEISRGHHRGKSNASANVEMIGNNRDSLKIVDSDQMSQRSKRSSIQRPDTPGSVDVQGDEKPTKRWQDYLKVATFPTELLSHTPSAKPVTAVINPESPNPRPKRMSTGGDSRISLAASLNPEPEMSPITAGKAEISQSTLSFENDQDSSAVTDGEPVKLLLAQLTELHDKLQREKTVKWNEFLRKVRAERKKEGEAATATDARLKQAIMPEAALADGEMIGVAGLGNKGKVGRAKWKEFKQLVLGGIPVSYRAKIWAECSGASALRVPGYYDDLTSNTNADDPAILTQIQMDIHRTLTDNVFFRLGPGVSKLNEVLLAYSRRNPEVGYCQGMNLITASLLLIMPTAEDTFWVLTSMIENILPQHYYDHSLLTSRADQQVLRQYVTDLLPRLSTHLDTLGIELEALTFQWFLSVFTSALSAEALFRVWDVVLCFTNDGSTFLFQVALALLKLNEGALLECDSAARVYGYIGNEMTDHNISIDGLIEASDALRGFVRREEVEGRRERAVEVEREGSGDGGRGRGSGGASKAESSGELSWQEPRPVDG
ncbi:hypothetical protein ACLMJK_003679 [Lecanora helva]